jgi:hypothetical protein
MTATNTFLPSDLFEFNNVNFDPLTATYDVAYYLSYIARWCSIQLQFDSNSTGPIIITFPNLWMGK